MGIRVLFIASAVAAASISLAQSNLGASIRYGYFYPSNGQAQFSGKTWTVFGGDLRFRQWNMTNGGGNFLSLSLDATEKQDYRNLPITLNYGVMRGDLYGFAGAGVAFTKLRISASETEEATKFAYQFGIGYNFRQGNLPLFLEVKWMGNSESQLSGWGVFGGVRF